MMQSQNLLQVYSGDSVDYLAKCFKDTHVLCDHSVDGGSCFLTRNSEATCPSLWILTRLVLEWARSRGGMPGSHMSTGCIGPTKGWDRLKEELGHQQITNLKDRRGR